ncbi:MAG: fibronectin type III domain-containing protein [Candidatus Dormibacteraeota bacterium]|nr:fibronectin type III domain-containing protein [Candidatus Dormibacteraeota bacterium]
MKFWSRVVMAAAVALAMSVEVVYAGPPGLPSRPSSPKATAGDQQVLLTWVLPTGHNPTIDYYTVSGSPGGISKQTPDASTSLVIGNLTNGTQYTFTVNAHNSFGNGPPSLPVIVTPQATPPGAPNNLGATPGPAPGQYTLTWTPPSSTGSSPDGVPPTIDHYTVTVSPGNVNQRTDAGTTTYVASGIADNQTYTFTVTATNSRKVTGRGATVYAPVPNGATIGLAPTAGLATIDITVTGQLFLNNETITLYWDDPSHVAGAVVTDGTGAFTKVVKPFAGDKPKIHKLCVSVQPKPCANFSLQAPPSPTPSPPPSPQDSPTPSAIVFLPATPARTRGGLSGLDIMTRPPFVFLPILGILGILGVLAYWAMSTTRRPGPPVAATVTHVATRPDYMSPFPSVSPPASMPPVVEAPPAAAAPPEPPPPAAGPTAPEPQPPTSWPAAPDEPPDLPQPSD